MQKNILLLIALIITNYGFSQVVTDNTNTVEYYVQNVLLGGGVTVSNITYNGNPANVVDAQVGEFTDATSSVGLSDGMLIGTGDIDLASQPNNGVGETLGGTGNSSQDPDLTAISTNTLFHQAIVEFDFIPLGDTLSFNYVFASEEYPEFVCSDYNDVFGFFLSGNNPAGGTYAAQNLALVPDPLVSGTFTTTAVAINTINPGSAGASGNPSNCSAIDPSWTTYSVFYQGNSTTNYEYDGRTVSLPVLALVNCGETYHIKMAIGDAGDANYDSGVFLEAGSFSSNGVLDATTADVPGNIQLCGSPFNVSFNTGPNPPPASYWDLGDGTTYTNTDTINHTYADSGTYVVMYVADDPSPCVQPDTAYFTVDIIQTGTLDAQIDIPPYNPCHDSLTVQLEFTGTGADSLYWDMGNGDSFINDTSIAYTYTTNGDFVITFQAFDFACGGFNTITDTIHFNPVFTSVQATNPGDQEFCGAPFDVDFTAGATPPPNSFWDFGELTPNDTSTLADVTYTYADTGSYTVMYVAIDSNTCNIADTAYFDITLAPAEVLSAQFTIPPYNDCQDSLTIDLAFTGSGADSLYWDMGDGTTYLNDILVSHTYTANGDFTITFEAYDLQCNNSITITDTVHFNPNFTTVQATSPGDQEICGAPYNVDFVAGGTPPNNYWDFGDGVGTSIIPDLTYTYADTGSYTVMFVAIDSTTCNIADTAYFDIHIDQPEQLNAQIDIPPYDPCDATLTIDVEFTGTGADSLYWDFGDGATSELFSVQHTYTDSGTYYLELQAYDFECNHDTIIRDTIYFNPNNTQVNTTIDPTVDVCGSNLAVDFSSGNPAPPQNYWDFGDGTNSTAIDPTHTYAASGTYNGFFVAIDSTTCNIADTMYFPITLNLIPELDVNLAYVPPIPCEAVTYVVDLEANVEGADSIYWNMGDGTEFFNDTLISYEYSSPGSYLITITLFKDGCPDKIISSSATFIELGETSGIIPNVFTPNGDGMNDKLVFVGVDHSADYSVKIFNRWGNKVFESTDATDHWDGSNAKDGTYFYELRYTDVCSDEEKLLTGTVTMLGKK